jgi:hypothetical protein
MAWKMHDTFPSHVRLGDPKAHGSADEVGKRSTAQHATEYHGWLHHNAQSARAPLAHRPRVRHAMLRSVHLANADLGPERHVLGVHSVPCSGAFSRDLGADPGLLTNEVGRLLSEDPR